MRVCAIDLKRVWRTSEGESERRTAIARLGWAASGWGCAGAVPAQCVRIEDTRYLLGERQHVGHDSRLHYVYIVSTLHYIEDHISHYIYIYIYIYISILFINFIRYNGDGFIAGWGGGWVFGVCFRFPGRHVRVAKPTRDPSRWWFISPPDLAHARDGPAHRTISNAHLGPSASARAIW